MRFADCFVKKDIQYRKKTKTVLKTKSLCTIGLTRAKPLIQLN